MKTVYGAFGLEFSLLFSTRPAKPEDRIGDDALWDKAEGALRAALDTIGLPWELNAGDGAFYGPKIDFVVTDSLGRKWQTCTIQLDYAAPERFDLTYVGDDNHEHRPVVIHRAVYGSFERFIAILTEHYAGAFPAWLAPVQARVVTVSDRFDDWAREVQERLAAAGWRVELDDSSDKLGAKIRNAAAREDPVHARRRREGGRGEGGRAAPPRRRGPQDDAARRLRGAPAPRGDAAVLVDSDPPPTWRAAARPSTGSGRAAPIVRSGEPVDAAGAARALRSHERIRHRESCSPARAPAPPDGRKIAVRPCASPLDSRARGSLGCRSDVSRTRATTS